MADKYKVLKRIDYGGKAWYPANYFGFDTQGNPLSPPKPTTPAGSNGEPIPIDISGVIELPLEIARELNLGQIAPLDDPDHPDVSGYNSLRDGVQREQAKKGIEDKIGSDEKPQWVEGAPRAVNLMPNEGTLKVG